MYNHKIMRYFYFYLILTFSDKCAFRHVSFTILFIRLIYLMLNIKKVQIPHHDDHLRRLESEFILCLNAPQKVVKAHISNPSKVYKLISYGFYNIFI